MSASRERPRSLSACPSSSASRATSARSGRAPCGVHALQPSRAAARELEAGLGVIVRRRQAIDVQVGGAGERLRIVGIERERAREGRLGLVEATDLLQRRGAIVVRLDRARLDARRFLGADERRLEVAMIVALGGAVEQRLERTRRIARRVLLEAALERPRRRRRFARLLRRAHGGALGRRLGRMRNAFAARPKEADRGNQECGPTHDPQRL